jgi:alpha-1,3-glucosyltransferase
MLQLENLDYISPNTLLFQRSSVLLTELLIPFALLLLFRRSSTLLIPLIYLSVSHSLLTEKPGLIFVDNIHFQYNGFLFAILIISIGFAKHQRYLLSALLFSILLNLKHIFLYIAPAYFVFLLSAYCFYDSSIIPLLTFRVFRQEVYHFGSHNSYTFYPIIRSIYNPHSTDPNTSLSIPSWIVPCILGP